MRVFNGYEIANAYEKNEVDAKIDAIKPYIIKVDMPNSSTVNYTDFENVVDSITANATGSITIVFKSGFVPRSFSFACQSNVVVGHTAPMPTNGSIDLTFKLVSTGGNFNPNEAFLNFYKA